MQAVQAYLAYQGSDSLQSCCWLFSLIWCLQPASPITKSVHSPLYAQWELSRSRLSCLSRRLHHLSTLDAR